MIEDAAGGTVVDLDQAAATGAIPVPSVATDRIVLEDGLVVGFSSAGGPFRTGDHWIVPARAPAGGGAVGDDPLLDDAPPLGIHHHYVRLGSPSPATASRTAVRNGRPPATVARQAVTNADASAPHA